MKIFASVFLIVFFAASCQSQSNKAEAVKPVQIEKWRSEIDKLFTAFTYTTPGYAIGIIKGENILYSKGYGSANLDHNVPISSQSAFDIASVSKQFTAACIALLIIEGKLKLEMPASNFIPQLKKYKDTIRIKHLVYNSSGIIDYHRLPRPDGRSWITFNYFTIDDCINVSLDQDTLAFHPGEKWDYCNVNFMLLARMVEKVSGQSFAEFARKRLFDPLGMKNTLINDDITKVIRNRVMPYNKRTKETVNAYKESGVDIKNEGEWVQHPRISPHFGGSGIITTVDDLLLWSKNFYTKQFGGDPFYELMHRKEKFIHGRNNQAFGLYWGKYKEKDYVAWDGGDWGISSQLIRFPDKGIAIVVLSNIGTGEAYRQANLIADILIENGIL